MEVPDVIVSATIQMLKDSKQMLDDLNSAYGSDAADRVSSRITKNIQTLKLLQDTPPAPLTPIPLDAIANCVNELMNIAGENGADSRSMPDDYVAVAHFCCYPTQYTLIGIEEPK